MKASSSHKGPYEFDQLLFVQDFKSEHIGPVWCMKFSACGRSASLQIFRENCITVSYVKIMCPAHDRSDPESFVNALN